MPWLLASAAAALAETVVSMTCGARAGAMFTAGVVVGAVLFVPATLVRARQIARQVVREIFTGERG